MYTKGYDFMRHKICPKCGGTFETENRSKKFCCRSCANSFTNALRKIPDESIFMNGISNTNAYVLGLIYSDGCLSYDNHCHRYKITISLNDFDILEKIHKLMTPNKKLYEYKHPNGRRVTYSIISCNEDDISFLKNLGMTERKSSIINFPYIESNYIPHFIRGYFDGDGSVYVNRTKTNYNNNIKQYNYINVSFTTGSVDFATQLNDILNTYNILSHVVKDSRVEHNSWYVKIYEKESLTKFYNWIYNDAELFLLRKKLKFTEMI